MASIYDLKPKFQSLLRPILRFLIKIKLTPNKVTLIALVGSLLTGIFILINSKDLKWLLILPIWLFIRMALNAMDGMMAREFNLSTNMGAVLNEVGDVLSDLFLYLPLAAVSPEALSFIVLFVLGAVITEFCGILGKALGATRHYEGPMGKSDRAFLIGLLAFLTAFFPIIIGIWKWMFLALFLMTVLTCKNRLKGALDELSKGRIKS